MFYPMNAISQWLYASGYQLQCLEHAFYTTICCCKVCTKLRNLSFSSYSRLVRYRYKVGLVNDKYQQYMCGEILNVVSCAHISSCHYIIKYVSFRQIQV